MLIKFKVENYRSFGAEMSLDMTAGIVRTHMNQVTDLGDVRLLSSAIVFGANASGKTNLVRAIDDSSRMIAYGTPIGRNLYCRTLDGYAERPSGFEYTIKTEGFVYSYGFGIDLRSGHVVEEWLNLLGGPGMERSRGYKSVFSREGSLVSTQMRMSAEDAKLFDVYRDEAVRNHSLLLRTLSRGNCSEDGPLSHVGRVMRWFRRNLVVIFPESRRTSETGNDMEHLSRMLSTYATGVTEVGFEKVEEDVFRFEGDLCRLGPEAVLNVRSSSDLFRVRNVDGVNEVDRLVFRHGDVDFSFMDESDGTKRLFDLSPLLDPESGDEITYVVDELDRSLHPQLARRFIKDFLKIASIHRRQLIATTHETRLMDLGMVRRDELWFVETSREGTKLYSLEDFNERGDRKVDRSYLEGRYGGVPHFRSLFPNMEEEYDY